ncbi:hypothetical protein PPYR_10485 [Photinus pyralis]|uniref:Small ribosomal subunit protein bS6m n=1 Tax=Photinus pyralis TaxID=7054 RepID=A0A1Y1LUW3_PHOPY|nr:probable 28S ribosomal protein S6, mitochondrial [Photinus pyralis]KAB0796424.1 hypothetical protein PPYR_10485 [Photinus pyralis]
MITHELMLLYRVMPKPELVTTLKRTAETLFSRGGIIRKLENLGTRDIPFKISAHGVVYKQASYYVFTFNVPPIAIKDLLDEFERDVDIIRRKIFKQNSPEFKECTLHEELQPAPYRKSVQELIAQARKLDKPKFNYNTGLDYYPFQK